MSSKKDVPAIVSAMGVFMAIISNLVELVKKFGGSMEDLYELATPKGREKLEAIARIIAGKMEGAVEKMKEAIYSIAVNYAVSVEDLVKRGKYDWSNDDITTKHFPTNRSGVVDIAIELIHLNRSISSENAIAELDKMGLRPAEAFELLTFGEKYPDVQREFQIIALGSVWRCLSGDCLVVCLRGNDAERNANLAYFVGVWNDDWRFAAVRK